MCKFCAIVERERMCVCVCVPGILYIIKCPLKDSNTSTFWPCGDLSVGVRGIENTVQYKNQVYRMFQ